MEDTNPDFWIAPNNHQIVKLELIRHYLNGWFPKLGQTFGRILYIDTHAGRGRFDTGQPGSPIVAIQTFLDHQACERIRTQCEVRFSFIEADPTNAAQLQSEVDSIQLPSGVECRVLSEDSFEYIAELVDVLDSQGAQLAPAFVVIDPYSYVLSGDAIRRLMQFQSVELFVNVIWRWQDMNRAQAMIDPESAFARHMNGIFPDLDWRSHIDADADVEERLHQTIELFEALVDAKWSTYFKMTGRNGRTNYAMLHLTKHDQGRDLMKEAMWKACPEGGFFARAERDQQPRLFEPTPNFRELDDWLVEEVSRRGGECTWDLLNESIRSKLWLKKQMNERIRELSKGQRRRLKMTSGPLGPARNPTIALACEP